MKREGLRNLAYAPDKASNDGQFIELDDEIVRQSSDEREIDFGACPHRFKCRGCGRDEYLHFDKVGRKWQLAAKTCPRCGEYLRGQIDTMYSNWLVTRTAKLESLVKRQRLSSNVALLGSILHVGVIVGLVDIGLANMDRIHIVQPLMLAGTVALLAYSFAQDRRAKKNGKLIGSLGLQEFLASEFPFC